MLLCILAACDWLGNKTFVAVMSKVRVGVSVNLIETSECIMIAHTTADQDRERG